MNPIESRILQISKDHNLSHLSSCLNAYPIIDDIYQTKRPEDKFVLSAGHCGLALYAVMESHGIANAEDLLARHGIHPDLREKGIDCATGSLGSGLPISLGIALADSSRDVYCLVSDGELQEGSCWESLHLKTKFGANNLKVHAVINGFSAYDSVDREDLELRLRTFDPLISIHQVENPAWLAGYAGHYKTL